MSLRGSSGRPCTCSGDMYVFVPRMLRPLSGHWNHRFHRCPYSTEIAKSITLTSKPPRVDTMMFSGFTSRCTTPL